MDRIISCLTYYTMGIIGLIWLIFSYLTRRKLSSLVLYNIYQSIFIAALLSIFSLIYGIAINILVIIPFIGNIVAKMDTFLNQTPIMYTSYTKVGFFLVVFVSYLAILALLGRRPYVPRVSDIIRDNFGV